MLFTEGVTDLKCASTAGATKQSCQQCGAVPCRALRLSHARVPTGVGANLLLVAHKLFPCNIPFVVVGNRDLPLVLWTGVSASLARAAIDDRGPGVLPSPDESAGIGGVLEYAEDAWIDRLDPDDLAVAGLARKRRNRQLLIAIPEQHLANAAQLVELAEDSCDGFLYLAVGVFSMPSSSVRT